MAHILLIGIVTVFAAQVLIVLWLMFLHTLRQRRIPEKGFPAQILPPLMVQDTEITLYPQGTTLFDAMLTAIQQAKETIFLETYIWKDDVLGQKFKAVLIVHAQAGVNI